MDDAGARSDSSARPRRRLGDHRQRLHRGRTRRDPRRDPRRVRERGRRRPLRAGRRHPARRERVRAAARPDLDRAQGRHGHGSARIRSSYADPDWRPRIQNGFGSGEGVVWEVRDEIVELESDGSDRTVDAGSTDKRLLIRQSEFASILKVAARDGSTLSELLREAWDGDTLANRTKGRKVVATNAHVSILAGCTPEELQRLVTATEIANGFLNRFLIVAVARERLREKPAPLPEKLIAERRAGLRGRAHVRAQAGRTHRA